MSALRRVVQRVLRSRGYELVPYPPADWVELRRYIRLVLSRCDINCVLDVGACTGDYGQLLRDFGYQGRIISFEPVPAHVELLRKRTANDGLWAVECYGIGSADETRSFNIMREGQFDSFLQPDPEASGSRREMNTVVGSVPVEVRRLDTVLPTLVPEKDARIFLKIDTQGFESEVLDGCSAEMIRIAALQMEVSANPSGRTLYRGQPSMTELLGRAMELGFDPVGFVPVAYRSDGMRALEFDCLMAKPQNGRFGVVP